MKVLFLCLYPENKAPSQRFRFEQFFPYLQESGISFEVDSFYTEAAHALLYKKGNRLQKALLVIGAYLKRLARLPRFRHYDYIFIQRAAAPIGPAFFEYLLARVFRKRIIYDFDDAIWMPQDGKGSRFFRWLKSYNKVGSICSMAYQVMVGNEFLADYARRFTSRVTVVPTVVDTNLKYTFSKKFVHGEEMVVGWTGSHSTIRYLLSLKDVLEKVSREQGIAILIIADQKPSELASLQNMRYLPWNEETEIADLTQVDAGIMPLVDNDWTRGKCGFKAIQYMALGIPALVSPVGVNTKIVDDGINGFVCRDSDEWMEKIQWLKRNPALREQMGKAARLKVEQSYSVAYAFPLILSLLHEGSSVQPEP